MNDHKGNPIKAGDRVIPICWGGGIPLYLCNTQATVTALGRTRVHVKFDAMTYGPGDRPHTAPPGWFRKIEES